jgi:hypothetical protein
MEVLNGEPQLADNLAAALEMARGLVQTKVA